MRAAVKRIALDVADKLMGFEDNDIRSHGYMLAGESYEVAFRYPISFDVQGEMIEEAEAMLAEAIPNSDWEYYAAFDDGPQYFEVTAVYGGY